MPYRPFLAVIALLLIAPLTHAAEAKRKPNIIFFLVDDMGWVDCGAYGSKYYETPNIDRFATTAMRFTSAYAQPLCSPTRCSLLTGKYSARHGITSATGHMPPRAAGFHYLPDIAAPNVPTLVPESKNYMEPTEYTLAKALRDAGYRTAHLGKWHLGLTQPYWPEQQGFDVAFHCHPDPGPPGGYFSPYGVEKPTGPDDQPTNKRKLGTITDGPKGEYIVDRLADEAEKFIVANKDRPFFLNLWNYGVHGPWGHKVEYTKRFADKKDPRGVQGNPIMASMLKSVDECFGRVLATLDRLGLADDTIIIFNSDNGGNTHSNTEEDGKPRKQKGEADPFNVEWKKWAGNQGPTNNAPLRDGKGTLYEGGTRVPLMWAWAGRIKPGSTSDAVVGHIDLYPTVLEMAGVPLPSQQKIDGVSYAKVLRGEGPLERKTFFNYFPHGRSPGKAGGVWARSGDWKLIRWFGVDDPAEKYELYDLAHDLGETKNLASANPDIVKDLDRQIDGFLADTGATYPRPNPAYKGPAPRANAMAMRPIGGFKAQGCDAVEQDGWLIVTGKSPRPFLGMAGVSQRGPVTFKLKVKSAGGAARIQWRTSDQQQFPETGQTVDYTLPADEHGAEVAVHVPVQGTMVHFRLYLPAQQSPVAIDWIELTGSEPHAQPQRWDFNRK